MQKTKKTTYIFQNPFLQVASILVLMLLAVVLFWFNSSNSNQAVNAIAAQVRFYGEYRIGDGPWQEIVEGQHISSTKGDVTLRGNFHMLAPDGEYVGIYNGDIPIAFYSDHISVTLCERGKEPDTMDIENPLYGRSACGVYWMAHLFDAQVEEPIEILIHNPHNFGNENAIDEMLSNVALWTGIDFEKSVMDRGETQRNTGWVFAMVSLILLGSALFSALLHLQNSQIICLLGAAILSAGMYLTYSSPGVSFWSESIVNNTTILGFSMMFYMLFVSGIIVYFLRGTKRIGYLVTVILGVADGLIYILPVFTDIYFYNTWLPWIIIQSAVNVILLICLMKEYILAIRNDRWKLVGMAMLLLAFEVDVIATFLGCWKGGLVSKYVFFVLFIAALFIVLRIIPDNINAAAKAKELEVERSRLEAELKESRISIMLSQIQPHFIYNTLGTIERMCLKDPQKAFELVRNFSLYLRGNFSELDSMTPIGFSQELKHVEHYVNIEKVRFPDMTIEYDIQITDFLLPALSVQPLVENAIKHGLMRLEEGGTVLIRTYETPSHFCVEVKDDGAGFDTNASLEGKKHVGLRNIRGRLKAMVNGELILESKIGVGTTAVIMIPKEVTE